MKRITLLFNKLISLDNLRLADEKARRGKSKSYGVIAHDKNREANLLALHEALLSRTYRTSQYEVFSVKEPKERIIYRLPYYPDRITHHAIMNILEPIWTRNFTHNTYSCIKGRGVDGCAREVERIIKSFKGEPLYCLKIDIRKFYPSIPHRILKKAVRRKIKDKSVLALLDEIIDSVAMHENGAPLSDSEMNFVDKKDAKGLPIGNYLSQYLANLVLCGFMHYVNEQMCEDIRQRLGLTNTPRVKCTEYADDICFFANNKYVLHEALALAKQKIEGELELHIKRNYQIFPIAVNRYDKQGRALDYVGFKFFREQKLIRKSIKQNFCRESARLAHHKKPTSAKEYKKALSPWLGWAKHSNSKHLIKTIIKPQYYGIL